MSISTISLVGNSITVKESEVFSVEIKRGGELNSTIEVYFSTSSQPDGTARPHHDYNPVSEGLIILEPFQETAIIEIDTKPNTPFNNSEPLEFFYLKIDQVISFTEGVTAVISGDNPIELSIIEHTPTPTTTKTQTVTPFETLIKTQTPTNTPTKTPKPTQTVTNTITQTKTQTPRITETPLSDQFISFEFSSYALIEGDRLVVKVKRKDAVNPKGEIITDQIPFEVKFRTSSKPDGTAREHHDYIPISEGLLIFDAGQEEVEIVIISSPDQPLFDGELDEFFYLELYDAVSYRLGYRIHIQGQNPIKIDSIEQTFTPTNTISNTETPTVTPSNTTTQTVTPTETPTNTSTPTETPTQTPTVTETITSTPVFSSTNTLTATITSSVTRSVSLTPTNTETPSVTNTLSPINIQTIRFRNNEEFLIEGSRLTVLVERADSGISELSVKYRTSSNPDGTAGAHHDYIPIHEGILSFPKGVKEATIVIDSSEDEPIFDGEPDRFFYLELYEAEGFQRHIDAAIVGQNPIKIHAIEQTFTPTNTPSHTETPSTTPSRTSTPTVTPTATITSTVTQTSSQTNTLTQTKTPTETPTVTRTETSTQLVSFTATETNSHTATPTNTSSVTPPQTQTPSLTPTLSPLHEQSLRFENTQELVIESFKLDVKIIRGDRGVSPIRVKYRTSSRPDGTAREHHDYIPIHEGVLEFDYGETEKNIEIITTPEDPLFNNEEDEHFYIELYDAESLIEGVEGLIVGENPIKVFILEQTPSQTVTPTQTPTHTTTLTETISPSVTQTETPSALPTNTPTTTKTQTTTITPTNSFTPKRTGTPTQTVTPTFTQTPSFTPTSTPVTGVHCQEFPFIVGENKSFTDLNLFVKEELYDPKLLGQYDGKMRYHVNFGDGQVVRNERLEWSSTERSYGGKSSHYYAQPGVYNAIVVVENEETKRRALCGSVEVIIDEQKPEQCSQLHIRAVEEGGSEEFFDAGINSFTINRFGGVENSTDINPIYGPSSISFGGNLDYFIVPSTQNRFNWIHNNTQDKWTIETWINLSSVKDENPIILNAFEDSNIGFRLGFFGGQGLQFDIFSGTTGIKAVNVNDQGFLWETKKWYHIAIVKYSDTVSMYINGEHKHSEDIISSNTSRKEALFDINIGKKFDDYFAGYMQDLRIVQDAMYPKYQHRITDSFDVPTELLFAECYIEPLPCSDFHLQSDIDEDDELSATLFVDLSINDSLLVVGNGSPVHAYDIDPVYGKSSIRFEDIDYLEPQKDFNFLHTNSENWTIQSWVYVREMQTGNVILSNGSSVNANNYPAYIIQNTINQNGIKIYYHFNGYVGIEFWDNGSLALELRSDNLYSDISLEEWFHLAVIRKERKFYLYINGTIADLKYSSYNSAQLNSEYNLRIGGGHEPDDFDNAFVGYMQDVIIHRAAVDENRIPPKELIDNPCVIEFDKQNPCPQLLIQSDSEDPDAVFNDIGLYQFEMLGNAVHSSEKTVFSESSSIKTFGTNQYLSTNFIKPETVKVAGSDFLKHTVSMNATLEEQFKDWQISQIIVKINGRIHKKASSDGKTSWCWRYKDGYRNGYKGIKYLSLKRDDGNGNLVEYELWDKDQFQINTILPLTAMSFGSRWHWYRNGWQDCRTSYSPSQIGKFENIFVDDDALFGIAGFGLKNRDDITFNIWPPLDGLSQIELITDFGVDETSFPDHEDQWRADSFVPGYTNAYEPRGYCYWGGSGTSSASPYCENHLFQRMPSGSWYGNWRWYRARLLGYEDRELWVKRYVPKENLNFDFIRGTQDFTIDTWVNFTDVNEDHNIVRKEDSRGEHYYWSLDHHGTLNNPPHAQVAPAGETRWFNFRCRINNSWIVYENFFSPFILRNQEWYHIALTRSRSSRWNLYINGYSCTHQRQHVIDGTFHGSASGSIPSLDGNLFIGKHKIDTSNNETYFQDFRIVKGQALDKRNYPLEALISPNCETICPKVHIQSNIEKGEDLFFDSTTEANEVIPYNGINHSLETVKYGNSSIEFNGNSQYLLVAGNDIGIKDLDFTIDFWMKPSGLQRVVASRDVILYTGIDEINQQEPTEPVEEETELTAEELENIAISFDEDGNEIITVTGEEVIEEDINAVISEFGDEGIEAQEQYIYYGASILDYTSSTFITETGDMNNYNISIVSDVYNVWMENRVYYASEYVYQEDSGGTGHYYQLNTQYSANESPIEFTGIWDEVSVDDQNFYIVFGKEDFNQPVLKTSSKKPINNWYHIAVSRDDSTLSMHVDGVRESQINQDDEIISGAPLDLIYIGKHANEALTGYFEGNIQDIRFYDNFSVYGNVDVFNRPNALESVCVEKVFEPSCIFTDLHLQSDINNTKIFDSAKNKPVINNKNVVDSQDSIIRGNSSFYFDEKSFLLIEDSEDLSLGSDIFNIELWVNFEKSIPKSIDYGRMHIEPTSSSIPTLTPTPTSGFDATTTPSCSLTNTPTQTPTFTPTATTSNFQTPTPTLSPRIGLEDAGITLMEHGSTGNPDVYSWMILAVDDRIKFFWSEVGDNFWTNSIDITPADFDTGNWHHLAISLTDKKIRGFADGKITGQGILKTEIKNSNQPLIIGRRLGASGAYFFKGYMQDIKISRNNVYRGDFVRPPALLRNCHFDIRKPTCFEVQFVLQGHEDLATVHDIGPKNNFVRNYGVDVSKDYEILDKPSLYFNGDSHLSFYVGANYPNYLRYNYTIDFWINFKSLHETDAADIFNFVYPPNFGNNNEEGNFIMYIYQGRLHIRYTREYTASEQEQLALIGDDVEGVENTIEPVERLIDIDYDIEIDTLYHMAVVKFEQNFTVYINGVGVYAHRNSDILRYLPWGMYLGGGQPGNFTPDRGNNHLHGYMQDIRLVTGGNYNHSPDSGNLYSEGLGGSYFLEDIKLYERECDQPAYPCPRLSIISNALEGDVHFEDNSYLSKIIEVYGEVSHSEVNPVRGQSSIHFNKGKGCLFLEPNGNYKFHSNPFTIGFWYNKKSHVNSGERDIIVAVERAPKNEGATSTLEIYSNEDGSIEASVMVTDKNDYKDVSNVTIRSKPISTGEWVFVGFQRNQEKITLHINKELQDFASINHGDYIHVSIQDAPYMVIGGGIQSNRSDCYIQGFTLHHSAFNPVVYYEPDETIIGARGGCEEPCPDLVVRSKPEYNQYAIADESANKARIINQGSVTHSDEVAIISQTSLKFNGDDTRLIIEGNENNSIGDDFTLKFKIYIEPNYTDSSARKPQAIISSDKWSIYFDDERGLGYEITYSEGENTLLRHSLTEEVVYDIAVVSIDGIISLFVDGQISDTAESREPLRDPVGDIVIGGSKDREFKGYIQELLFYKNIGLYSSSYSPNSSFAEICKQEIDVNCDQVMLHLQPRKSEKIFLDRSGKNSKIVNSTNVLIDEYSSKYGSASFSFQEGNKGLSVQPYRERNLFGSARWTLEMFINVDLTEDYQERYVIYRVESTSGKLEGRDHVIGFKKIDGEDYLFMSFATVAQSTFKQYEDNTTVLVKIDHKLWSDWVHLAINRYYHNNIEIFVDGSIQNEKIIIGNIDYPASEHFTIGSDGFTDGKEFLGNIEDLRFIVGQNIYRENFNEPKESLPLCIGGVDELQDCDNLMLHFQAKRTSENLYNLKSGEEVKSFIELRNEDLLIGIKGLNGAELYRSLDRGRSWELVLEINNVDEITAIEEDRYGNVFIGCGSLAGQGDIYRSVDGGTTWEIIMDVNESLQNHQIVHFIKDVGSYLNALVAGVGYNDTVEGKSENEVLWISYDQGDSWEPWLELSRENYKKPHAVGIEIISTGKIYILIQDEDITKSGVYLHTPEGADWNTSVGEFRTDRLGINPTAIKQVNESELIVIGYTSVIDSNNGEITGHYGVVSTQNECLHIPLTQLRAATSPSAWENNTGGPWSTFNGKYLDVEIINNYYKDIHLSTHSSDEHQRGEEIWITFNPEGEDQNVGAKIIGQVNKPTRQTIWKDIYENPSIKEAKFIRQISNGDILFFSKYQGNEVIQRIDLNDLAPKDLSPYNKDYTTRHHNKNGVVVNEFKSDQDNVWDTERFKYNAFHFNSQAEDPANMVHGISVEANSIPIGDEDATIDFWFRPDFNFKSISWDSSNEYVIFHIGNIRLVINSIKETEGTAVMNLFVGGESFTLMTYASDPYQPLYGIAGPIEDGTWYHFAMSKTGTAENATLKVFINGIKVVDTAFTDNDIGWSWAGNDTPGYIGGFTDGHSNLISHFSGYIQDFRYIRGEALYNKAFLPQFIKESNTDCNLDECAAFHLQSDTRIENNKFKNSGKEKYLITPAGSVTHSTEVTVEHLSLYGQDANRFRYVSSVYFDGNGSYLKIDPIMRDVGSQPFALEVFIYPTTNTRGTIFSSQWKGEGEFGANTYWSLVRDADGFICFESRDLEEQIKTTVAAPRNTWTHIILEYTDAYGGHSGLGNRIYVTENPTLIDDNSQSTNVSHGVLGLMWGSSAYPEGVNSFDYSQGELVNQDYELIGIGPDEEIDPFVGYMQDFRLVVGTTDLRDSNRPNRVPYENIQPMDCSIPCSSLLIQSDRRLNGESSISDVSMEAHTLLVGDNFAHSSDPFARYGSDGSVLAFFNKEGVKGIKTDFIHFDNLDFTFDFWFYNKKQEENNKYYILSSTADFIQIYIENNKLNVNIGNVINKIDFNIELETWYHFGLIRRNRTFEFYINAEKINEIKNNENLKRSLELHFAKSFIGYMQDIRYVRGHVLSINSFNKRELIDNSRCFKVAATVTPSNTISPTNTPTVTPTFSSTSSVTATVSATSSLTPTLTPTSTITNTYTATPTASITKTATSTQTRTLTPTETATQTATQTVTNTETATPTKTSTATVTPTETSTETVTPTRTSTETSTPTMTPTHSPTQTITQTQTASPTSTYLHDQYVRFKPANYFMPKFAGIDIVVERNITEHETFEYYPSFKVDFRTVLYVGNDLDWDINSANEGEDFKFTTGTLEFDVNQFESVLEIKNFNNDDYSFDSEFFFVELLNPRSEFAKVKIFDRNPIPVFLTEPSNTPTPSDTITPTNTPTQTQTPIDNRTLNIRFQYAPTYVVEGEEARIKVLRAPTYEGIKYDPRYDYSGKFSVKYEVVSEYLGASEGQDFIGGEGIIYFEEDQNEAYITVQTIGDTEHQESEYFNIIIKEVKADTNIPPRVKVHPEVIGNDFYRVLILDDDFISNTPSNTPSHTVTPTYTPSYTTTPTVTPTQTVTKSNTKTPTNTPTNTKTPAITPTNSTLYNHFVRFDHNDAYLGEGSFTDVKIFRDQTSHSNQEPFTVQYRTLRPNNSASEETDYFHNEGVVEFYKGQDEALVRIFSKPIPADFEIEREEYFLIELFNADSSSCNIEVIGRNPYPVFLLDISHTPTPTETITQTPSNTQTPTQTPTKTQTPTVTPTNTSTNSITPTKTTTLSFTATETPSITSTITPTPEELGNAINNERLIFSKDIFVGKDIGSNQLQYLDSYVVGLGNLSSFVDFSLEKLNTNFINWSQTDKSFVYREDENGNFNKSESIVANETNKLKERTIQNRRVFDHEFRGVGRGWSQATVSLSDDSFMIVEHSTPSSTKSHFAWHKQHSPWVIIDSELGAYKNQCTNEIVDASSTVLYRSSQEDHQAIKLFEPDGDFLAFRGISGVAIYPWNSRFTRYTMYKIVNGQFVKQWTKYSNVQDVWHDPRQGVLLNQNQIYMGYIEKSDWYNRKLVDRSGSYGALILNDDPQTEFMPSSEVSKYSFRKRPCESYSSKININIFGDLPRTFYHNYSTSKNQDLRNEPEGLVFYTQNQNENSNTKSGHSTVEPLAIHDNSVSERSGFVDIALVGKDIGSIHVYEYNVGSSQLTNQGVISDSFSWAAIINQETVLAIPASRTSIKLYKKVNGNWTEEDSLSTEAAFATGRDQIDLSKNKELMVISQGSTSIRLIRLAYNFSRIISLEQKNASSLEDLVQDTNITFNTVYISSESNRVMAQIRAPWVANNSHSYVVLMDINERHLTPLPSRSAEATSTPTQTPTQSSTQTPTNTITRTETPTNTVTKTETPSVTQTPTRTNTPTLTPTETITTTFTPTETASNLVTPTVTLLPLQSIVIAGAVKGESIKNDPVYDTHTVIKEGEVLEVSIIRKEISNENIFGDYKDNYLQNGNSLLSYEPVSVHWAIDLDNATIDNNDITFDQLTGTVHFEGGENPVNVHTFDISGVFDEKLEQLIESFTVKITGLDFSENQTSAKIPPVYRNTQILQDSIFVSLVDVNSPTPTRTETATPTVTPSYTPTNTPTLTETITNTITNTSTETPTNTVTPSFTSSNTITPTQTITPSLTTGLDLSKTPSVTMTLTSTNTVTTTPTNTNTITSTNTNTPTNTVTNSITNTVTPTNTLTQTITSTETITPTLTSTETQTQTQTPTNTLHIQHVRFQYEPVFIMEGKLGKVWLYRDSVSGPINHYFEVDWRTSDKGIATAKESEDFYPLSGTLKFYENQISGYIDLATVPVPDKYSNEIDEFFYIEIYNVRSNIGLVEIKGVNPCPVFIIEPSNTPTPTNTITPTFTPTNTITNTQTITKTPTETITSTQTITPTESNTQTPTRTITPTQSASQTPTQTITPTETITSTQTITPTQSSSQTPTVTPTETITSTQTITPTQSSSQTPTVTPTETVTSTQTITPTETISSTPTQTVSATNTISSTQTITPTKTISSTQTITPTKTVTHTETITPSVTISSTQTITPTQSSTQTPTQTITPTETITSTQTTTPTKTITSTQTATPTETITSTQTVTPTETITSTQTVTPTETITPTQSSSQTPTQTITPTETITSTQTITPTKTITSTQTVTPTETITPTQSSTQTPTQTITPTKTITPTQSSTQTPTQTITPTETITSTQSSTQTPTQTITPTETITPTQSSTQTPTQTITPTETITSTQTITPTKTITSTQTITPTQSSTQTPTQTITPTETITSTQTVTPTKTITRTQSSTQTPTQTVTPTETITSTQTVTPTETITPTQSSTQTPTQTITPTETVSSTQTITPTRTISSTQTITPTQSNTQTPTKTITPTETITSTQTITPTETITSTQTVTPTETITPTQSNTQTPTQTVSITQTITNTLTNTVTSSLTPSITQTPTQTVSSSFTPTPSLTPAVTQYVRFTYDSTFMNEGDIAEINVYRTIPFSVETKIDYSTSGIENSATASTDINATNEDYLSGSGTLIFTNTGGIGDYMQTIYVTGLPIPENKDDPDHEPTEVFFIWLYNGRSESIDHIVVTGANPYPVFILEDRDPIS